MGRNPRIEFEGAVYHVMSRGNHQEAVFLDDHDNRIFLDALEEACSRTGWRVHAFVLMGNHYHLLMETPEPNLVAGMQWLQGTYTKRFNVRHKEWGHLFQGRYKALLVGREGDYFSTVAAYIHLNPARIRSFDFEKTALDDHAWSSYPGYVGLATRPEWLCVDEVFIRKGLRDTAEGRYRYRELMARRVAEMQASVKPWMVDENWKRIRRGWCFGDEAFRKEMVDCLDEIVAPAKRESFSGEEMHQHDTAEAERLVQWGLTALDMTEEDLPSQKKGSPQKYAIAWLVRKNTSVRNDWIKKRLQMGSSTNFSGYLRRLESAQDDWGVYELNQMKNIIL